MFNTHEGSADERASVLQRRLEILKRAREDGFFDEEPTEKMPKITADGEGPDDGWLGLEEQVGRIAEQERRRQETPEPGVPNPYLEGSNAAVLPHEAPAPKYQAKQLCHNCANFTRHISYGQGSPTWHCVICCTCDWCMQTVERQAAAGRDEAADRERAREQVERGREALHDAVTTPVDQLSFCTKCGAGLRCGVCNNEATGNYCDLCGKKIGAEGFCTDCWKEPDLDG